ncbi:MAG: hypothetical protein O7D29_12930, partial [Gemmatimonadetes bacterium]|nr:hypothetical protein [Gemmatimonadota bacterium]
RTDTVLGRTNGLHVTSILGCSGVVRMTRSLNGNPDFTIVTFVLEAGKHNNGPDPDRAKSRLPVVEGQGKRRGGNRTSGSHGA